MERTEWTLGENDAGRRLDRILRRVLKDNAQGAILSALRKGLVRLNGKKARAGDITKAGDLLSAASFLLGENSSAGNGSPKKAPRCPYPIVFQNENLLFIDKPAGTPTHGKGSIAETFAPQKTDSLAFVQAPLHRLDKGTSGLLAVSKSAAGARWFCKNIKDHSIKKFYWGITLGDLQKEEEWIDSLDTESGPKSARTIATPLKRGLLGGKKITLVRFQIFTGRKRQIRAQCAARGIPILGDKFFGGALDAPGMAKSGGFYLRSMRMEFPQNELGIPEAIEAQEPQDFLAFFK